MSYKPKKTKGKRTQKVKDPNKFHLGRNSGTYLIIFGSLLAIVLLLTILFSTLIGEGSYLGTYKANKVTPYVQADSSTTSNNYPDAVCMEGKDFKEFDIKFYATSIDTQDAHSVSFAFKCVRNDNTPSLLYTLNSSLEQSQSSSSYVYAGVCLAANWVGVNKYSSLRSYSKTNFEKEMDEASTSTITVSLDTEQVFPMKTANWPVKVTVDAPDAYLFVCYLYGENGLVKKKQYILHYSYDEYYVPGTTSPAI